MFFKNTFQLKGLNSNFFERNCNECRTMSVCEQIQYFHVAWAFHWPFISHITTCCKLHCSVYSLITGYCIHSITSLVTSSSEIYCKTSSGLFHRAFACVAWLWKKASGTWVWWLSGFPQEHFRAMNYHSKPAYTVKGNVRL